MPSVRSLLFAAPVLGFALGCGPTNAAPPPTDPEHSSVPTEETAAVPDTPATPATSAELPASLHVVVFFAGAAGPEHLDVQVLTDDAGTAISGVHADESRAHPITRRITLDAEQRAEFARLIGAIGRMPRCEPLARFPDEPLWQVESEHFNDTGPSLWLRENGDTMMRSTDPCLAYVRLAHFVYATWMQTFGPDR
ncbi:MAG: hypothetical protein KC593_20975 [Myxococcales bacterium]|nr:hypothetical protein [Myxococcales bacterium]